jgi:hypothetical protein
VLLSVLLWASFWRREARDLGNVLKRAVEEPTAGEAAQVGFLF